MWRILLRAGGATARRSTALVRTLAAAAARDPFDYSRLAHEDVLAANLPEMMEESEDEPDDDVNIEEDGSEEEEDRFIGDNSEASDDEESYQHWVEMLKQSKTVPDAVLMLFNYMDTVPLSKFDRSLLVSLMVKLGTLPTGVSRGKLYRQGVRYLVPIFGEEVVYKTVPKELWNWTGDTERVRKARTAMLHPDVLKHIELRERLAAAGSGVYKPLTFGSSALLTNLDIPEPLRIFLDRSFLLHTKYAALLRHFNIIFFGLDFSTFAPDDLVKLAHAIFFLKDATALDNENLLSLFWNSVTSNVPKLSVSQFISIFRVYEALDYKKCTSKAELLKFATYLDNFIEDISFDDMEWVISMFKRRKVLWASFFHKFVDHYRVNSGGIPGHDLQILILVMFWITL
jgi:hypothetical protein